MGESVAPARSGATSWIQLMGPPAKTRMLKDRHARRTRAGRANGVRFFRMRLPPRILEIAGAAVAVVLVAVALQRTLRFPVRPVPPPAAAKAPRAEPGGDVIAR